MRKRAYDRLTFLDTSFLLTEGPTTHMHIAGTATYEAGPLKTADGGIDIDKIRAYVESRLDRLPRYRQILSYVPIENHPVWVDDQHFNIHYHVRHTALPRPGDARQLKRLSGRIVSQQLDRSKPLWEMWVVEGVEGDKVAVLNSVRGTHKGDFIGLQPTGRKIDAMAFQLYRIENGQLAEHWEVADLSTLMRQLQG